MSWLPTVTPAALALAGIFAVASGSSQADGAQTAPDRCAALGTIALELPEPARVDEIRVTVAPRAADDAEAELEISAGAFGRVVHVYGGLSKALRFTTPLDSRQFSLALSARAHRPAPCIERIELRAAGALVASHEPRGDERR